MTCRVKVISRWLYYLDTWQHLVDGRCQINVADTFVSETVKESDDGGTLHRHPDAQSVARHAQNGALRIRAHSKLVLFIVELKVYNLFSNWFSFFKKVPGLRENWRWGSWPCSERHTRGCCWWRAFVSRASRYSRWLHIEDHWYSTFHLHEHTFYYSEEYKEKFKCYW